MFYDAQLGRFHTQDRFAEKYYSMSPYQYAANNPIKYIDVNGDSIYINYSYTEQVARTDKNNNVKTYKRGTRKGQTKYKTEYKTGTLTYTPGMETIGNDFADNVINSLNKLDEITSSFEFSTSSFENYISDMASDESNTNIFESSLNEYIPDGGNESVFWNPSYGLVGDTYNESGETNRMSPLFGLAHELGHAHLNTTYNNSVIKKDHLKIISLEKQIAKRLDVGSRSYYGAEKGNYIAPTPFSIKGEETLYNK